MIAIDVVRTFPDRAARRPERYAMPRGKSAGGREGRTAERALALGARVTQAFHIRAATAPQWTSAPKDVIDRAVDLEMAYNPERLRRAALGRGGQE